MSETALVLAIAGAVVGLLIAEHRHAARGVWLCKPLASLGFVALGLLEGVPHDAASYALLFGLVACAAGDVLLIPAGTGTAFLAGIASFALGHLAYAISFFARGVATTAPSFVALAMMTSVVAATLRWLRPHLPHDMRVPVHVYMLVISVMVIAAVGCSVRSGDPRVALGAVAFAFSDLSVARERFVKPAFVNLLWGLPLYYAAQVVLAHST